MTMTNAPAWFDTLSVLALTVIMVLVLIGVAVFLVCFVYVGIGYLREYICERRRTRK